jgi:hypothetical protein
MANSKKSTPKSSKPAAKKAAPKKSTAKKAPAKKAAPAKKTATKKAPAKKTAAPSPKKSKNLADSISHEIKKSTGFDIDSTLDEMRHAIKETSFETTTTSAGEASISISFTPPEALKKLPWFKRIFKKK